MELELVMQEVENMEKKDKLVDSLFTQNEKKWQSDFYDTLKECVKIAIDKRDKPKRKDSGGTHEGHWYKGRRVSNRNETGMIGVYKDKNTNKYYTIVQLNGVRNYLGRYSSVQEAAAVRENFIQNSVMPKLKK